jgi:general stress protein 26
MSAENPRRTQMSKSTPIPELNEAFSEPNVTAPSWSDVEAALSAAEMFWLSTVRRDGRPHVTPLPAIWLEGALHICVGRHEQKAKNLARDSRCVLTTGTNKLRSGLDVVVEGTAVRVTDRSRLFRLAELWRSKLDWPFEVGDGVFRDPGGREGLVFRLAPAKVLAFGKAPFTQTRYRFPT